MNDTARTRRRRLSVLVSLVLVTAACAQGAPPSTTPAAANLDRFYRQQLAWKTCAEFASSPQTRAAIDDPRFDCAYLTVPIDYTRPGGRAGQIAVLRQKAGDQAQRIGSLLVNPGGPGASGVEAAADIGPTLTGQPLGRRFDLVGFDPRGVGASKPTINCFTGPERDADRLDLDVDNSPAGVAQTEAEEKDFAAKCEQRSGGKDVLANVGTRDVVRDLDILRAALGDEKLTYLGYSYGTQIGYTYAEAFPANVRALVLDGALDPNEGLIDHIVNQNAGFQRAFDAYAASCAKQPGCPLGSDPARAVDNFHQLVLPLIENPVALPDGRRLSYPDAMTGTTQALYSDQLWDILSRALAELSRGRGGILKRLADVYYGREPNGQYAGTLDAFSVINCVDDVPVTDPAVWLEASRRVAEVAPFRDDERGPNPARGACAFWPVPHTSEPHVPRVSGLPTVMVISVTGDPATPYAAGVSLAKGLGARLLSVEGNQHTVALQGVACVDDYVTRYLVDPAALPPEGARCAATPR